MSWLALAVLLATPSWGGEGTEQPADIEIRREMERAESENLENAAAGAEAESAKGFKLVRGLLAAGAADLEAARVELEGLLRDPEELRRQLGGADGPEDPVETVAGSHEALLLAGQMIAAKTRDFLVKASSVPFTVSEEDSARLIAQRDSYSAKNRAADLRRARGDAEAAARRLGVSGTWGTAADALAALEGCVAEVKDAAAQTAAALRALTLETPGRAPRRDVLAGARDNVLAHTKRLEADARDLEQETDLLRSNLVLQKANRHITGQATR